MDIEAQVGQVYRPLEVQINGAALAESARRDIITRQADVTTKSNDVTTKHSQVQTWHGNVSQWQQDSAAYRDQANTYSQQANTARTAAETAQSAASVAQSTTVTAKNEAVSARNSASTSATAADADRIAAANSATQAGNSASAAASSATTAENHKNTTNSLKSQAETAKNAAVTAKNTAVTARDKSEDWAEKAENSAVETGKYSAKHHALKSEDHKQAAEGYKNSALSYRDSANTHKNNAASSATSASSSASSASSSATTALTHRNKAEQWASADSGVVVESGEYSAKHYALLAETQAQAVTSGLKFKGAFDVSSGNAPTTPALDTPDYYRVTGNGTINGVTYNAGDNICWDPTTDQWFKIDNTDRAITSGLTSNAEDVALSAKAGKTLQDSKIHKTGTASFSSTLNYTPDTGTVITFDGKPVLKRLDALGALSLGCDNGVIIGSGESAATTANNENVASEELHLSSDNQIRFNTNLQGGWAGRRQFSMNTDGSFVAPTVFDSSGRVYSPGNQPQWNDIGNKPSSFTPASHTHDYLPTSGKAADSNLLDGLDSSHFARRDHQQAAVSVPTNGDWVSIAVVQGGGRASARFKIGEGVTGNHGHVEFYAATSFGNTPTINILSAGGFGSYTGLLRRLRIIKDTSDTTYGAHKLQLLLEANATLDVYMYEDEAPHDQWMLLGMTEVGLPSGYLEAVSIDLDKNGGIATTGEMYCGDNKVFHEGNLPPIPEASGGGGGGGGRKNFFINGDFRIWQRGESFTHLDCTADRWNSHLMDSVRVGDAIRCTNYNNTAAANAYLSQVIESCAYLQGKTVTISFKIKANMTTTNAGVGYYWMDANGGWAFGSELQVFATPRLNTEYQTVSHTFEVASNAEAEHLAIRFYGAYNPSVLFDFEITDIQLELGDTATEFERTHIGTELALCQRYYFDPKYIGSSKYFFLLDTYVDDGENIYKTAPHLLPVSMRKSPTVSLRSGEGLSTWGIFVRHSSISQITFECIASVASTPVIKISPVFDAEF